MSEEPTMEVVKTGTNTWPATQIEMRAIADLKPYDRNARTHSLTQIKQIAKSMRQWGWTMPVLIDEDDRILAGHARVRAAKKNRYTDAPVIIARGWSEAQKRAYVIADNKLSENGGWDREMLATEISALGLDFDVDLLGFNDKQLAAFLGEEQEADTTAQLESMKFSVVIDCESEDDQTAWLQRLEQEGVACRALIS